MKQNLFLVIVLIAGQNFFLLGCGPGIGDVSENLGNGYTYMSGGSLAWISPGGSLFVAGIEGDVTSYKYDNNYIIATQEPSERFYKGHFASYLTSQFRSMLYNDIEIKDLDVHQRKFLNKVWWRDTTLRNEIAKSTSPDNYNDDDKISSIVDSVIKVDPYYKKIFSQDHNYWIIRKKDYELFGPFSKEEYVRKRMELCISKNLKLE